MAIVAAVLWTGVIFFLGTVGLNVGFSNGQTDFLEYLGHYLTHFVLASLLYRSLLPENATSIYKFRTAVIAFSATVVIGLSLEAVQLGIPGRSAEIGDGVSDILGAGTGTGISFFRTRRSIIRILAYSAVIGIPILITPFLISESEARNSPPYVEDCGSSSREFAMSSRENRVSQHANAASILQAQKDAETRVTSGLVALYEFKEGSGDEVHDASGVVPAVNLKINDGTRIKWLKDTNGIEFVQDGGLIQGKSRPDKIFDALTTSDGFTLEAWVWPKDIVQGGPVRIVSMSDGWSKKKVNFHLGQQGSAGSFRVRTICNFFNWENAPDAFSEGSGPTHLVATYDGVKHKVYSNGNLLDTVESIEGHFGNWNPDYPLLIGNEGSLDRQYHGKIFLIAIYDRPLTHEEIIRNLESGPTASPK